MSDLRNLGAQRAKRTCYLSPCVGYSELLAANARLRADLTKAQSDLKWAELVAGKYETDLAAAQEREQRMREALEWLNAELDAYWNDHTQSGKRPPEAYVQRITAAQMACAFALQEKARLVSARAALGEPQ